MIRLQLETCFVYSCDEFDEDLNEYQGDEDKLERAELHKLEQQLSEEQDVESQEEKDYRLEFFELLDEVLFLLGKNDANIENEERCCLRDTSLRFQRTLSHDSPPSNISKLSPVQESNLSKNASGLASTNTSRRNSSTPLTIQTDL